MGASGIEQHVSKALQSNVQQLINPMANPCPEMPHSKRWGIWHNIANIFRKPGSNIHLRLSKACPIALAPDEDGAAD